MSTHLHRLIELRGEHFGCLQFRKVATYYCKVLKTGREVQQRMVLLDSWATYLSISGRLREQGPPPGWDAAAQLQIAVPKGPNERW
jgi:hypothetical protein